MASNFERYLYYLLDCDSEKLDRTMELFKQNGQLDFTEAQKQQLKTDFSSASIDDSETLATIRSFHKQTGYVLDPHTAIGVAVGKKLGDPRHPLVCLATAHPAKFGDVVQQATGLDAELPPSLAKLVSSERKFITLSADKEVIKNYISSNSI